MTTIERPTPAVDFARERPGRWIADTDRARYVATKTAGKWILAALVPAGRCVTSPPLKSRDEAAAIAGAFSARLDDASPTAEARMRFSVRDGLRALYPMSDPKKLRR